MPNRPPNLRRILRAAACVGALVVAATACGDDDDGDDASTGSGTASTGTASDVTASDVTASDVTASDVTAGEDPAGDDTASDDTAEKAVVRIGYNLERTGGYTIDPAASKGLGDGRFMWLVYDTLIRAGTEGDIKPGMAREWEIVDPNTIRLTLQDAVFSDGTPFDAEAVKLGLERNRDSENASFRPELQQLSTVEVTGEDEVVLGLAEPIAGEFLEVLTGREGMIVSPDSVAAADGTPVGAGPFVVADYQPSALLSLRPHAGAWDAAEWGIGGVDLVQLAEGPPLVNALRAGTIDLAIVTPDPGTVELFSGDDNFGVFSGINGSVMYFAQFCMSEPPFDNPDVRRAISLAIDREAINDAVLGGEGEVAAGLWPSSFPQAPESSVGAEHDPEQARQLLQQAGVENLEIGSVVQLATPAMVTIGEIVQAQLADVGVTMELVGTNDFVTDWFQERKAEMTMPEFSRAGLQKLNQLFGAGIWNVCGYSDPEMDRVMAELAELPADDPARDELWREAQQLVADQTLIAPIVFQPQVAVWASDKVSGVEGFLPNDLGIDLTTVTAEE